MIIAQIFKYERDISIIFNQHLSHHQWGRYFLVKIFNMRDKEDEEKREREERNEKIMNKRIDTSSLKFLTLPHSTISFRR
jgi:hypothetical protein